MDKKTMYTRAPWKYDKGYGCKNIKGGKHGTHRQAQYHQIAFTTGLANEEEDEANARLMAAAPQLLEACKVCVKAIDIKHILSSCPTKNCEICEVVELMKAAIATAEGE